jgi:hypothetical protein
MGDIAEHKGMPPNVMSALVTEHFEQQQGEDDS